MLRQPSWIGGVALAVVTLADVHYLEPELNPTMPARFLDAPPVTRQLAPEKRQYRIFHSAEWDWIDADLRAEGWFGSRYGPWWFIRNGMMPRTPPLWGYRLVFDVDYADAYLLATTDLIQSISDVRDAHRPDWERPFLAMSNAWYSSRFRDLRSEEERTGGHAEAMIPVDFVPAPERYPRYYFADQIEQVDSREMFVQKLLQRTWSPRVAFVPFTPFMPASGRVSVLRETAQNVTLDATAAGRALLVISITPHKYWHATIDGASTALHTANIGFQCLSLPPGRHTIHLVYKNPLVGVGITISLLALVAIAIGAVTSPFVPLPEAVVTPKAELRPPRRKTRKKRRT
jgi:hypothetical protein